MLGAAADQDAGQQVQRSRHGVHQEHEGEQRQGEEGLHSREAHLQDELIQNINLKILNMTNYVMYIHVSQQ